MYLTGVCLTGKYYAVSKFGMRKKVSLAVCVVTRKYQWYYFSIQFGDYVRTGRIPAIEVEFYSINFIIEIQLLLLEFSSISPQCNSVCNRGRKEGGRKEGRERGGREKGGRNEENRQEKGTERRGERKGKMKRKRRE